MKKIHIFALVMLFLMVFLSSCSIRKATPKIQENKINKGTIYSAPIEGTQPPTQFQSTTEMPVPGNIVPELLVPVPPPSSLVPPVANPQPAKQVKSKNKAIGSYSTPLLNRNRERVINISLAARKINGYVLKQGEIFSFNDVVGERTVENGFKLAAVIVKGEYEKGVGGGVCQLSTTMFNAADKGGFEIIERHSHSKNVRYVPPERDAAVSYPYLDFKFKNTKDYPVKIKASASNGRIYVSIWKA